jgi:BA14K-like protein
MKTSIFYYCAFAFVVLSGVLFGLDWQPATLSPMPPIQVVALPPPPPPPPVKPPEPVAPPVAAAPSVAPNAGTQRPGASRTVTQNPAAPVAVAPANPPVAQTPPKPLCDVAACAAAYRSFRESDCTFNPSVGPRQLCTKGVVPSAAAAPLLPPPPPAAPAVPAATDAQPSIMQPEPNARPAAQPAATPDAQPAVKCNVSACAAAYRTFTESDCTFMASGGQRKLCTR